MERATPDVSFVTTGHDIADARLHRHISALTELGLACEVLGLGDPGGAHPDLVRVRSRARRGMAVRLWRSVVLPWKAEGRVLVSLDPDSASGCRRRRLLSPGLLYVADVHEDYAAVLRDRPWAHGPARWLGAVIAKRGARAASRADLTSVADGRILPDAPRRVIVRNVPLAGDHCKPDPKPRAVYVGDIRRSRGVFSMLDSIARNPAWTLDLIGPIAPDDREEVLRRIGQCDGRVRWHDRLPPTEAWALARGAWVGFSLLSDTPAFRDALPSKLYEYAAAGIPVVATALPGQQAAIETSGAGRIVGSTDEVDDVLVSLAANPEEVRALGEAGRQWSRTDPAFSEGSPVLAAAIVRLLDERRRH